MGWQDLLDDGGEKVLPWLGGNKVFSQDREWTLKGRWPREHGWYSFNTSGGRIARLAHREPMPVDPEYTENLPLRQGYLVGDRFIPDDARVDPDPAKLILQTEPVFCVEIGLERFTRATVARDRVGRLIYVQQEWPQGPEADVLVAYQDRLDSVGHITGVTPALDLAFRWISYQRAAAEARAAELERLRAEEEAKAAEAERVRRLLAQVGTAVGRRELAAQDFETAARMALRQGNAELLDVRPSRTRGEMVVQYIFRHRRLECVVDARTLRIIDAGVCLDNHAGTKGDTFFTLESLPGVIGEAIDRNKLVVWRHA